MRKVKYINKVYNKLTILEEPAGSGNSTSVKVRCECGTICTKRLYMVVSGNTTSCDCVRYTAGRESRSNVLYNKYMKISSRCNRVDDKDYPHYGGRGIKCEWKSFIDFKNDMEESYLESIKKNGKKNTTIERIDNNKNYCKENCKWATLNEQSLNRTTSKFLTVNGITKNYSIWAKEIGCSRQALRYRVVNGLPPELILTTPFKRSNKYAKIIQTPTKS